MPAHTSSHDLLASWLREHATTLEGLDPAAPLNDLEPLRDIGRGGYVTDTGDGDA